MDIQFECDVGSDFAGFHRLSQAWDEFRAVPAGELIHLHFRWFGANLLAVLGAFLDAFSEQHAFEFHYANSKTEEIFQRNEFLSYFGGVKTPDYGNTAIPYKRFSTREIDAFIFHVDQDLFERKSLPSMSSGVRKKIEESIFEIFENARSHGQCSWVYTCGQFYPRKQRLDFTMVDLGRTIKRNVSDFFGQAVAGVKAIDWAVQEGHTTKQGEIPGGLGLSLIREFVEKNDGRIQIVSADGYWLQRGRKITRNVIPREFPGTVVNLEFNLTDPKIYYLKSELEDTNIL
jgi:hypothetical protein